MEAALNIWMYVSVVLVMAGAVTYLSLISYMTGGDE
jgi:hypothetical protein